MLAKLQRRSDRTARTVKVGLSTADEVTDPTTLSTELVASVATDSTLSETSALAMAA